MKCVHYNIGGISQMVICKSEIKVQSILGRCPFPFFRGVPACPSAGAALTFTFHIYTFTH